jgi:hypothetical protein
VSGAGALLGAAWSFPSPLHSPPPSFSTWGDGAVHLQATCHLITSHTPHLFHASDLTFLTAACSCKRSHPCLFFTPRLSPPPFRIPASILCAASCAVESRALWPSIGRSPRASSSSLNSGKVKTILQCCCVPLPHTLHSSPDCPCVCVSNQPRIFVRVPLF